MINYSAALNDSFMMNYSLVRIAKEPSEKCLSQCFCAEGQRILTQYSNVAIVMISITIIIVIIYIIRWWHILKTEK